MKTFEGMRSATGVAEVTLDGRPLKLRLDLANHSPTGFEWGYGGSGPSQLALAICAEVVGDERALAVYQDFKMKVLAGIYQSSWTMTEEQVLGMIQGIETSRLAGELA